MQRGFWIRIWHPTSLGVTRIASILVLNAQGTHWKRKTDGAHLCYFCKKMLETHAKCRECAILLHYPNNKYTEVVQTTNRWYYEKRLCRYCQEKRDPNRLIEDIADFLTFSTTLGEVDLPEMSFR